MWSVPTIQLFHCDAKAAIDNSKQMGMTVQQQNLFYEHKILNFMATKYYSSFDFIQSFKKVKITVSSRLNKN